MNVRVLCPAVASVFVKVSFLFYWMLKIGDQEFEMVKNLSTKEQS